MRWRLSATFVAILALASAAQAHEGDFGIGSSVGGGGQLLVEAGTPNPIPLPAVSGLLNGFALNDPGFTNIDEPAEGIFGLLPGTSVVLEVLAIDADFKAYAPGFADTLDLPGETWTIGTVDFDEHLTWHIDSGDPDYVPGRPFWTMQFRVLDPGGTYAPSDPVTAEFVPEPASALLALVLLGRAASPALIRRNRRRP